MNKTLRGAMPPAVFSHLLGIGVMGILELIGSANFWTSLANIMLVNIVLSGDNAVVIALAAHALPAGQQRPAIIFGSAAAIIMRAILTIFAIALLNLSYLKIVGGILLFYIAVKLMAHQHKTSDVDAATTIWAAVRTILLADLVMSLDNVLGVAAASHGNLPLLIAGLALSVPMIVFGSTFVLKIMQRFPIVVMLGAALLGYLGGEMFVSDPAFHEWGIFTLSNEHFTFNGSEIGISMPGALSAVAATVLGIWRSRRSYKSDLERGAR